MEHVAILARKQRLLGKILAGEKTIESRWSKTRRPPFRAIAPGEIVYFKESGCPVSAKATVQKVLFFDDLDDRRIRELLATYHDALGVSLSYAEHVKGRRYCTLIFLAKVQALEPFAIDKQGFGLMAAWLSVPAIAAIRR